MLTVQEAVLYHKSSIGECVNVPHVHAVAEPGGGVFLCCPHVNPAAAPALHTVTVPAGSCTDCPAAELCASAA